MQKTISTAILFLLLCSFKGGTQAFVSKQYGFSLEVPKSYEIQKDYGEMIPVMIYTATEGSADDFRENINVVVQPFEGDLDTYYLANIAGMPRVMQDFKLLKQTTKKVNGLSAHYMVYTFTYNQQTIQGLAYVFAFGGNGFVITCSSTPTSFNRYQTAFEAVAQSFKKL